MNRYPLWKYAILVVALLVGLIYTLPNFFGEAPAVQVSSGRATIKLGPEFAQRVEGILSTAGLKADLIQFDGNSVKARFANVELQGKAKDALSPRQYDPATRSSLNTLIQEESGTCGPRHKSTKEPWV